MTDRNESIRVLYFAALQEKAGKSQDAIEWQEDLNGVALYEMLQQKYGFTESIDSLRLAVNESFVPFTTKLKANDEIAFIPPVAGG